MSPDEICGVIREAGIVGMGGAGFPTATKIKFGLQSKIEYLLINAAECEPFLNPDYRLMLERPDDIMDGILPIIRAFGLEKAYNRGVRTIQAPGDRVR
jgi:electron transport complex protein RnfC